MSPPWPKKGRAEYARRLLAEGVECPDEGCGELFLTPGGLAQHRRSRHGIRQPKPRKPKR